MYQIYSTKCTEKILAMPSTRLNRKLNINFSSSDLKWEIAFQITFWLIFDFVLCADGSVGHLKLHL